MVQEALRIKQGLQRGGARGGRRPGKKQRRAYQAGHKSCVRERVPLASRPWPSTPLARQLLGFPAIASRSVDVLGA